MPNKAQSRQRIIERLEMEYLRSLKQLTTEIDKIVRRYGPKDAAITQTILRRYAETVRPWARIVAERMLQRVSRKDAASWIKLGNNIGKALRKELDEAPTGQMLRQLLAEQVHLITSLPLDAADRVHKLTMTGLVSGRRAEDIAKDILQTGQVTHSRAKLIARTEVARTASGLTMARAQHVGSTHYIWRTSRDPDVRESHRQMEGKVIAWDTPPTLSDGTVTHAGMIYNCRCYPEPILSDD